MGGDDKTKGLNGHAHVNGRAPAPVDEPDGPDTADDDVPDSENIETADLGPSDEGPISEVEPPPIEIRELAAACVRFVASRYKVPLDFEVESLAIVDQYVKDARAEITVRPESLELVQDAVGAYFGEVVRQAFGGSWFCVGDKDAWRVDLRRVYLTFNPLGMAREALLLETAEGWHAHLEMDPGEREAVEARLAILPDVDEAEYYLPSTRFEVIAIAHDQLRVQMMAAGHGDVRFGPEDYRR